jgi:site-specific recombinase XerD
MKLLEAIENWVSWKSLKTANNTIYGYRGNLLHFCIFLRNPEIENINLDQIIEYLGWCQKMGFKGSSLEKYGIAIKELIEYYKKQGYEVIDPSLIPIPKIYDRAMPRVLDDKDFEKLVKVIPKESNAYYHIRNRAIIWMLFSTGARVSEVANLKVSDLDVSRQEAFIKTEKSRDNMPFRKIFWTKECARELNRWLEKRKELIMKTEIINPEDKEFLFLSVNGGCCGDGKTGRRIDIGAIGEAVRKYSRLAGLKYTLNPHSFRHRMGRELVKKGTDVNIVSQILGHKSLDSSRIYTILSGLELGRIYHKVMGR